MIEFRKLTLAAICLLAVCNADAQQTSKPGATEGPTLQVTTQFIRDTINNHGSVGFFFTSSFELDHTERNVHTTAVVSPSPCALHFTQDFDQNDIVNEGYTYPYSGQDLHSTTRVIYDISLRDIKQIRVEGLEEMLDRTATELAATSGARFPQIRISPAVFQMSISLAKTVSVRSTGSRGNHPPTPETVQQRDNFDLLFRDQDTADRAARALLHATDLCGGGSKSPF